MSGDRLADALSISLYLTHVCHLPTAEATIRVWAHRGHITRHRPDRRGRTLYDLTEVREYAETRKAIPVPTKPPARRPTLSERFWSKVDKEADPHNGCWLWMSVTNNDGYGRFGIGPRYHLAHRVAWELEHGETLDSRITVDHICENPRCVNPAHLEPVSLGENIRRSRLRSTIRELDKALTC